MKIHRLVRCPHFAMILGAAKAPAMLTKLESEKNNEPRLLDNENSRKRSANKGPRRLSLSPKRKMLM